MAKIEERYANALLEISEEGNTLEEDLEQAIWVKDALDIESVQIFLTHPQIPSSEKRQLLSCAFSEKLSKHLMGLLYLMIRKNHESLIVPALGEYIDKANRRLGRIEAKVVSARALTEKQIESIHLLLSRQLNLKVKIKATVDTDVIGGFYILVNGLIFDSTVRYGLNHMKNQVGRGKMMAKVYSAKALTKEQTESIGTILSKQVGMDVEVKVILDTNVIGGFYILVDGRTFDATLRTELDKTKKRLKRGNYE